MARLPLLSDQDAYTGHALLERSGIDRSSFDASSRDDPARFIPACLEVPEERRELYSLHAARSDNSEVAIRSRSHEISRPRSAEPAWPS